MSLLTGELLLFKRALSCAYYRFMPSNPNQLLELKIAGRYRMIPVWASKLPFEVRPGLKFDSRAWKLWKPVLTLLNEIAKKEKLKIN